MFTLAAAPTAASSGMSVMAETFRSGGVILVLIVVCSIVTVAVTIITWQRLRNHLLMPEHVVKELKALSTYATRGSVRPLQQFLAQEGSMLARVATIAVGGVYLTKQECVEACANRTREELHKLERDMPFLEVMVTVAPLLGLLGTTAGMVGMFSNFGDSGGEDTGAIAKEIGVALRCTIAGLLVAVPAVIAHTYFARRIDAIAVQIETLLLDTIIGFYQHFEVQRGAK
jgi:biopolymer transport protein ExbB